jgi:hypothetical protein
MVRIRAKINETERNRTKQRTNETKKCFLNELNRIDILSDELTKRKRRFKLMEQDIKKLILHQIPLEH